MDETALSFLVPYAYLSPKQVSRIAHHLPSTFRVDSSQVPIASSRRRRRPSDGTDNSTTYRVEATCVVRLPTMYLRRIPSGQLLN